MSDKQITLSEHRPLPDGVGTRDVRGTDRLWRWWKAGHLVRNPATLSRLLGRRVK